MSSQFHNRLVGTVVLVALGVIFLPDILDGKKERHEEVFSEIPLRPSVDAAIVPDGAFKELDVATITEPVEVEQVNQPEVTTAKSSADVESDIAKKSSTKLAEEKVTVSAEIVKKKTPVKAEPKKVAVAKKKPAKKPDVERVAWTLQLGSFNHAGNVKALVAKLRKAGITTYTLPSTPVDGQLTKVFVGPDVSTDKLKVKQKQVKKLTKLEGRIVAYKPLNK